LRVVVQIDTAVRNHGRHRVDKEGISQISGRTVYFWDLFQPLPITIQRKGTDFPEQRRQKYAFA